MAWDQDELISKPAECDLVKGICGGITKNPQIMLSARHSNKEPGTQMSTLLWNLDGSLAFAPPLFKSSLRTLTHSSPQGCAQKPEEQKEKKKNHLSPSVVAKGTQSACLCCDWIIILLLIRIESVFSVDCSQRGRAPRAIQQHRINPRKASQRSSREQAGGRASRPIPGNATATGCAGQSRMAPGQKGRKAITYSVMSHLSLLSVADLSSVFKQLKEQHRGWTHMK